jgi:hypothetical protein
LGNDEAMKLRSNEAFNAGKENEAMKRLMIHCFIALVAQLW